MLARSELENLAQIIMMFTPQGLTIIEEERYLRGRAVQLGLEYNDQTSCEDVLIAHQLCPKTADEYDYW